MSEVLDKKTIKALGADARQDIMKLLTKRPHTASEISKITGKHVTTITEHLTVLEKSDLVRKKDSTNKWVYYTLTDKGEHLFKPQFYSWVVVFSLSIVFIFVGMLRFFNGTLASATTEKSNDMLVQNAPLMAATIESTGAATSVDYVAYALVILGLFGIAYLVYRKYKK